MTTLWDQLKPEYKKQIKKEQGEYKFSPQKLETTLRSKYSFTHLTVSEVLDLYTWTNLILPTQSDEFIFGEHFLTKEK